MKSTQMSQGPMVLFFICWITLPTQWQIQGVPPACTPPTGPVSSFWHTNFSKCSRLGSWRPPYEVGAPHGNPGSATATDWKNWDLKINKQVDKTRLPRTQYHRWITLLCLIVRKNRSIRFLTAVTTHGTEVGVGLQLTSPSNPPPPR